MNLKVVVVSYSRTRIRVINTHAKVRVTFKARITRLLSLGVKATRGRTRLCLARLCLANLIHVHDFHSDEFSATLRRCEKAFTS